MNRYRIAARSYDFISGERWLYQQGRVAAVALLQLQPGDAVLDLGCGTGLDFPWLQARIGATGRIVGIDASAAMLAQARRRTARAGWANVDLVVVDAAQVSAVVAGPFDAVLCSYTLSVMADWDAAWTSATSLLRPGGHIAVVDTGYPTQRWKWLSPMVFIAFRLGGVHPRRRVWERVLRVTEDPHEITLAGGHIHVVGGRRAIGPNLIREDQE